LEVKEGGRWVPEGSFRTYVDIVGALAIAQRLRLDNKAAALRWLRLHLLGDFLQH
jgi:hypothetical protein